MNKNNYILNETKSQLELIYKGNKVIVFFDYNDYDKIRQYHWRITKKKNKYYVCTGQCRNGNKILYLANIIMDFIPNKIEEIDHINGNSLDNRKQNLRKITRIDNIHNSQKRIDNTSGIRGVSQRKRWAVYC